MVCRRGILIPMFEHILFEFPSLFVCLGRRNASGFYDEIYCKIYSANRERTFPLFYKIYQ